MIAFPLGFAHDGCVKHLAFGVSLFSSAQSYGHGGDPQLVKVRPLKLVSLYISLVFSLEGMAYFSSMFGCWLAGAKGDGGKHGYKTVGSQHCIYGHANPAHQACACPPSILWHGYVLHGCLVWV